MVVGQANNNGNPKPDSGGRHINRSLGEENRLELLVRRPTTARKIVHSCWSGDQQRRIIWRGKSYMVVGQANNHGNRNHSCCWSGKQQRKSKARLRRAAY
jgi:hypothetical protein